VTLTTVLVRQRRPLLVAGLLSAAGLWISIPLDHAQVGVFFAIGIFLSLLNHVLTEVSLARSLETEGEMSRKQFAMGSFGRLALVTIIGFVIALVFWPYGAAVFVGLALMHLVMLIFTGLPLLNELKKA
jgi:hypothetical protein